MSQAMYAQMIGDIAGRFIGGGGSSGKASARQYYYNNLLQQQAQAWNEKAYKHRYQWQVQDLEKAGINKLYGLGNAPAITTGANSIGMEDDQGAENGRRSNMIAMMGLAQDWSAKKAQIDKIKAETKTEEINTRLVTANAISKEIDNEIQNMNKNWTEKHNQNQYDEAKERIENLKAQRDNIIENTKDLMETRPSRIEANRAQSSSARASAKYQNAQTKQLTSTGGYDAEVGKEKEKILKQNPWIKKVQAISEITGETAGSAINAATGNNHGTSKTARKTAKKKR